MLLFKTDEKTDRVSRLTFKSDLSGKRLVFRLLPLLLMLFVLAGCDADNPVIAPEICDAYEDALFTIQMIGGAALVIGLALLAIKKSLASIFPSQGAQTGAIAMTVGMGIFLLTFASEWGTTLLSIFGLPDMYTLCGL
jgi:hypothetical protein